LSPVVVLVAIAVFARFVYPGFPAQRKKGALKENYGSWALVTGASAGIGTEFAHQLAKEGFNVIVSARRLERLEEIAKELSTKYGVQAKAIAADLSTKEGPYELHKAVQKLGLAEGGPGLIINNAGFGWFGKFHEQELKHIEEMIQLNCTSVAVVARLFVADLNNRKQRGGMIITGSIGSYFAGPTAALYDATKVFDSFLAVALNGEQKYLNKNKVDICALEPGGTATEFQQVAGSDPSIKRTMPDTVVNVALNALIAGFPSIIPVHSDHFNTFASYLSRQIYLPIILKSFQKLSKH
jgi:short-subunit dehydrogenase